MDVSSVMTRDPVTAERGTSIDRALALMEEHGVRHLPLFDGGELSGIVSDRDLLSATGGLEARVHACRGPGARERLPERLDDVARTPVITLGPHEGVEMALALLLRHDVGCLPVLDEGRLVGVVGEVDLLRAYADGRLRDARPTLVAEHMTPAPTTIDLHESLGGALLALHEHGVRHLPVVLAGELVGMVSDRDLRRALGCGRRPDHPLEELVTPGPVTVDPDMPLARAARLLEQRRIGSLPVVERGRCAGILTVRDVLEHLHDTLSRDDAARGAARGA